MVSSSWSLLLAVSPAPTLACRFALYASGTPASPCELLTLPAHSLLEQSSRRLFDDVWVPYNHLSHLFDTEKNKLRNHKYNTHGWGAGVWSDGAWNMTRSGRTMVDDIGAHEPLGHGNIILGHVRAAVGSSAFLEENSHPFLIDGVAWMHNGAVSDVAAVMKSAQYGGVATNLALPADIRESIGGHTDSELALAIYAAHLRVAKERGDPDPQAAAMRSALWQLVDPYGRESSRSDLLGPFTDCQNASSLNFGVSDGEKVIATRFRTCDLEDPPTLYLSWSMEKEAEHETGLLPVGAGAPECAFDSEDWRGCPLAFAPAAGTVLHDVSAVWMASEPLDRVQGERYSSGQPRYWSLLPKDVMVVYDVRERSLQVTCLSTACASHSHSQHAPAKESTSMGNIMDL